MALLTCARSTVELAQQRAAAQTALGQSLYRAACARGFLAAVDWLDGRGLAPISGDPAAQPGRERLRAADAERQALHEGRQEDAWFAGYVALTLGWATSRTYPQTPFV